MYGQAKVYELITKIVWTNQSTRNALSEVENLIIIIIVNWTEEFLFFTICIE